MLNHDDERTLQVLEAVASGNPLSNDDAIEAIIHSGFVTYHRGGIRIEWQLTDAGRAKLSELREKKGRGE